MMWLEQIELCLVHLRGLKRSPSHELSAVKIDRLKIEFILIFTRINDPIDVGTVPHCIQVMNLPGVLITEKCMSKL